MSIHATNLEHGEHKPHCCARCEARAIVRAAKQGNKAQRQNPKPKPKKPKR